MESNKNVWHSIPETHAITCTLPLKSVTREIYGHALSFRRGRAINIIWFLGLYFNSLKAEACVAGEVKGEVGHNYGPSRLRARVCGPTSILGHTLLVQAPRNLGFHTLAGEYSRNRRQSTRFLWSQNVVSEHGSTWVRWHVPLRCLTWEGLWPKSHNLGGMKYRNSAVRCPSAAN
jgi:hypothetical protein